MSRAESPLRDRVIFLVGARRSGTNWLRRILTAHPGVVAMPSETYLFSEGIEPLTERFQHANPLSSMMGKTFMERERFLDGLRDFVDGAFLDNLERLDPGAPFLLERTPWHAQNLPLIADVYPDAHVVHIVRDGRSVARSLVSMEWGPSTMVEAAEEWRHSVQGGRGGAALFGPRFEEVVYEQLLADPIAGAKNLFGWLELDWNEEIEKQVSLEAGTEYNVDPASPGIRKEKWRDALTPVDLEVIDAIAGEQLEEFGYERTTASAATPAAAAAPARGPGRPASSARRLRSTVSKARRPRQARDAALERLAARRSSSELTSNHEIVEMFENLVAVGRFDEARRLLAPDVWTRFVLDDVRREGRGAELADDLLGALEGHRTRGLRPLTGDRHSSPIAFTAVGTYELNDGSRWTRTMIFEVRAGLINSIGLYRFEVSRGAG